MVMVMVLVTVRVRVGTAILHDCCSSGVEHLNTVRNCRTESIIRLLKLRNQTFITELYMPKAI